MNAWLLRGFTGLDQLQFEKAPDPVPQSGEVVLELRYAALNPADRYMAEGQYPAKPSLPHILGRDGAGTIVEAGPDVHGLKVGEAVLILRSEIGVNKPGTFADRVAVPVASLAPLPAGWSLEQ